MGRPPKETRNRGEVFRAMLESLDTPKPRNETELKERILAYADWCVGHDCDPTYEGLVSYCGLTMHEALNLSQGNFPDICGANAPTIFVRAAEAVTGANITAAMQGTNKATAITIFGTKQIRAGGGYQDTPKATLIVPDLLADPSRDRFQITSKYNNKVIDVDVIQEEPSGE